MIRKWQIFFFSFLLSVDIVSKMLAIESIPAIGFFERAYPYGGIGIFDFFGVTFSLNYVVNTGAAWGMFAGHSGVLFALRTVIILSLVLYLFIFQRGSIPRFPLWLVVTGAAGNALDYCFYGHVIDFLHFTFWGYSFPIFNIADSCITLGVFSIFIFSRRLKKHMRT